MTEKKKPKGRIFTKGGKGGPGRPRKDKTEPEAPSSSKIRKRFFNVFWDEITEKELKELISTKKNRMLFLQEIRRMLPTTQEADRAADEFVPLKLIVASESDSKAIDKLTSEISELRLEMARKDRFLEAYLKTLKAHGIVPELKHEPERPLELAQAPDGTFKSEGEQLLEESEGNEEEEDNYRPNAPRRDRQ